MKIILIQKHIQGKKMSLHINRIWHTKVVIIELAIETY
jgi:hypothetical protein|tara:strand:+ start:59 stop:172 length:114 start_codon:yes stop_codon:yes gene_type:complete